MNHFFFTSFIFDYVIYVRRIGENLQEYIPNLDTLMLDNNMLQELSDVDPLATLPKLAHVR